MRPVFHAALALLLLAPSAARAQEAPVEVRAGSALVDAWRVSARTDTFAIEDESGPHALLVIRTAMMGDSAVLRVERTLVGSREISVDSFAARRPTLVPLFDEHGGAALRRLTFPTGRVVGDVTPRGGAASRVDAALDPPAFYMNTTDLLLASLPLAEGRRFDVRMWDPEDGPYVLRAHVARGETVTTLEGGRCDAWRVETDDADRPSVYWVDKQTQSLLAYAAGDFALRIVRSRACPAAGPERSTR
jgi:hypothetical protein